MIGPLTWSFFVSWLSRLGESYPRPTHYEVVRALVTRIGSRFSQSTACGSIVSRKRESVFHALN